MTTTTAKQRADVGLRVDASVLIVDIRNFTPNLSGCRDLPNGHNVFYQFLSQFYDCCVQACAAASMFDPPDSLYINSTGDGTLSVFLSPKRHFLNTYLAGLVLSNVLPRLCGKYNRRKPKRIPDISFGIGINSGSVRRIASRALNKDAPTIETYIGNCINIAARIEAVTKDYARTSMLISEKTNWLLCKCLFKQDYRNLMHDAINTSLPSKRKHLWNKMNELNESLLVSFMHEHNLRGVSEPVALFRLSPTLAVPQRKEFQSLLSDLCVNNDQLKRINQIMSHSM